MAKKKVKPVPVKTGHYNILSTASDALASFTGNWEIRNRLTSKEAKAGVQKDTQSVLGTLSFAAADEFGCSELTAVFGTEIPAERYAEILTPIVDYVLGSDVVKFVRISTQYLSDELKDTLTAMSFIEDPVDKTYLIRKPVLQNWTAIYMLLGLSVGTSIGTASGNLSIGMCLGIAVGMLLGTALSTNQKKQQETDFNKRLEK